MPQDTITWLGTKGGQPAGPARITKTSPHTRTQNTMTLDITPSQWDLYTKGGTLIQRCFPQLTGTEREFIQTGYTAEDWEAIFGKQEQR